MLNKTLTNAIAEVMNTKLCTQYRIDVSFLSESDSTYQFSPLYLDSLSINQNPSTTYMDVVRAEFRLSMNDYATMYDHIQDLYAVLTFTYCNGDGTVAITRAPIVKSYRATIVNPHDVRKSNTDVKYRTQELDMSTKVDLIEQEIYVARSADLNTIYQRCPMADAIRMGTHAFGLLNLTMVPPDNTHIYDHVLVPPVKSVANYYGWLQAKYGVYMAGMCHYYTSGHLHVYPPYDVYAQSETSLVVYQAEQGMYAGSVNYARIQDGVVEVVTNTIHRAVDHSVYGSENIGTSIMFVRSSELVDGMVQADPVQGVKFSDDVVLNLSLNSPKTLTGGKTKTVYAHATDNPWALSSHILEKQATVVDFEWSMAIPFQIRPGMGLTYYSDENGNMVKRSGIVDGLQTTFARAEQGPGGRLYKAVSRITVRTEVDGTVAATTT